MKRTYCVLLSLLLVAVLALTGCGNAGKGAETKPNTTTESEGTNPATTEKTDAESAGLGKVEGKVYTNTYVGLGCKLDDNWVIASAEELQDVPDEITEILNGTELGELANNIPQIMDMQAQSLDTGASVNVLYTKMSALEKKAYEQMNEEEIVDTILKNKDIIIESYANTGIEVQSMDKATMDFLGEKHTVCKTVGTAQGVEIYLVQVLDYKLPGQYGVTVTFCAQSEEEIANIMSCFYKVD